MQHDCQETPDPANGAAKWEYPLLSEASHPKLSEAQVTELEVAWAGIAENIQKTLLSRLEENRAGENRTGAYIKFLNGVMEVLGKKPDQVQKVAAKTGGGKKKQAKQLCLPTPYPTDLTRCSPFFPVKYSLKNLPTRVRYLRNIPLVENSWGTLMYSGPELTTHHEDLLLALLYLVQKPELGERCERDGHETRKYTGSLRKLLVTTGCMRPAASDYDRAFEMLKDLASAVASISNKKGKCVAFSTLISGGSRDDETFSVTLSPEFLKAHNNSMSYQDLACRMQIKSLIGKALFRFMSGQSKGWSGSLEVLYAALGLKSGYESKRGLLKAISELKKLQILTKTSGVTSKSVHLFLA
ncbi:MAG: hypothetical protein RBQ99_04575 [Trichlorobacter sp.]|nr:hypothetical protein [Trichlorobacter sp.]